MHDIAKGLGWRIFAEAQIKHAGAGAPKTIDFVLYRSAGPFKPGVLFIEVKYVAGTNMSALLSRISYDFEKLGHKLIN